MRNLLKPKVKTNPFVMTFNRGMLLNCFRVEYNIGKSGLRWRFKNNIMLADVNGTELEFPDINAPEEVQPGVRVNVNGEPATGSYKFPDGTIIACKGGIVTAVTYPNSETKARHDKIRLNK